MRETKSTLLSGYSTDGDLIICSYCISFSKLRGSRNNVFFNIHNDRVRTFILLSKYGIEFNFQQPFEGCKKIQISDNFSLRKIVICSESFSNFQTKTGMFSFFN